MGNSRLSGGSPLAPQEAPRRTDLKIVGSSNGQKEPQCYNVVYTKRSKKINCKTHIIYESGCNGCYTDTRPSKCGRI